MAKGRGGPAKGPGRGGPARGYSWPPFEKGNTAALTHGAFSDKVVMPRAHELVAGVLGANSHLTAERDGAAVMRYAIVLSRLERVYQWLSDQEDAVFAAPGAGEAHAIFERLERWERQADAAEDRLAIAPLTRARLGLDQLKGIDLAAALAALDGQGDE